MIFGVRPSSLFTSRWMALGWAILICLTAIEFVGGRSGGGKTDKDAAAAQNAKPDSQNDPDQMDAQTKQDVDIALKALN